jgi:hypothetical protein
MEAQPISETLVYFSHLTPVSTREDFSKFRRRESFETYKLSWFSSYTYTGRRDLHGSHS